jgi:GNAT superfamily N-acetyltransferase
MSGFLVHGVVSMPSTAAISMATMSDYAFLSRHDIHVSPAVLTKKINDGQIIIAYQGGVPVGWLRFGFFWDTIPFMHMLVVLMPYRGTGIGTQIINFWEAKMMNNGYKLLMTSTLASENAQHLYRKLGYRDSGALLLPNEPLEIILLKPLSDEPSIISIHN